MKNARLKVRIIVLVAVTALLLLGTGVLAQSGEHYIVKEGTATGGGYRLTSLSWQVSGAASGGGYRLLEPAVPASLVGSGCCCTYLPGVLRDFP
jgi:hypothetical protein